VSDDIHAVEQSREENNKQCEKKSALLFAVIVIFHVQDSTFPDAFRTWNIIPPTLALAKESLPIRFFPPFFSSRSLPGHPS
jgi:hypothetical protein